jgi:hypothetical protein
VILSCFFCTFLLSGCTIFGSDISLGAPEEEVIARYGHPITRYQDDSATLLEYASFYAKQT